MLGVRKQELLTNGVLGIANILFAILYVFAESTAVLLVSISLIVVFYVGSLIYKIRVKQEPWDELTIENYAKARRITLLFVELTLLIWGLLLVLPQIGVVITAAHVLFYYGAIKLVQTGAFLYYDSHAAN